MINKVINSIKSVFIPKSELGDDITVNMDGGVGGSWSVKDDAEAFTADAKRHYSSYTGVPAPVETPNDSWFGEAPKTEKVIEYVKQKNEELYQRLAEEPQPKEVDNIHEVMYNKATAKGNTTVQLDPQPQGGSENVWQSGAGPHF
jgi:hypothetical protein